MSQKKDTTSKSISKVRRRFGESAALIKSDVIHSHRIVSDAIRDQWVGYEDPAGNSSSSPNSFMTLRKHWNRLFGIRSVNELDGDPERSLLYALANIRSAKAIAEGVKDKKLRPEIRQATYAEFEKVKSL